MSVEEFARVDVDHDAAAGEWSCSVTAEQVPHIHFPGSLTIGSKGTCAGAR